MRASLKQRLQWLENGHEGDPVFNYARAQRLLDMPMGVYFSGCPTGLKDLKSFLESPDPDRPLEEMTYGEVVRLINEYCHDEGFRRKRGVEALWVLGRPFVLEGQRRRKKL